MPIPFLAHQAVVLPLKACKPRAFDGVALVIGSIAPDMAYALLPEVRVVSHNVPGFFTWCLPMALSVSLLTRYGLVKALVRAGVFRLRSVAEKPWTFAAWVVGASIGCISHVLWDALVHPDPTYKERISLWLGAPGWLYTASNVLGGLIALVLGIRWWRSLPAGAPRSAYEGRNASRVRSRLVGWSVVGVLVAAWDARQIVDAGGPIDRNTVVMRCVAIVGGIVVASSLPSAFAADGDSERLP